MDRTTVTVCTIAIVVLAGCGGIGTGKTSMTDSPTSTETALEYESFVFDTASTDEPVLSGGLTYPANATGKATYDATLLSNRIETTRFTWQILPTEAEQFVNQTDFETASLLVIQAFPKSSVPDYQVKSVTVDDERLSVRVNDSSQAGTGDITLETVLLRVDHDGSAPTSATVTTQDGVVFDTGSET